MLDFSVSFGTGQFVQEDGQPFPSCSPWLCPRWMSRLWQSVRESLSASRNYHRLQEELGQDENPKHHRLDPVFVRHPIPVDAGEKVEEIKDLAEEFAEQKEVNQIFQNVRLPLVAAGFYAVARCPPIFDARSGLYYLRIAIVSRWNDDSSATFKLQNYLRYARFWVQGRSFPFSDPLMITITVKSLETTIAAQLELANSEPHNISGFPISIADFIFLQSPISLYNQKLTQKRKLTCDSGRGSYRNYKQRKLNSSIIPPYSEKYLPQCLGSITSEVMHHVLLLPNYGVP